MGILLNDLAGASGNPRRLLCCLAVLNLGPTVFRAPQLVTARQGLGTPTSARPVAHPAPCLWQGHLGQVYTRAGKHVAFIKNRRCSCFGQRFPSSACPFSILWEHRTLFNPDLKPHLYTLLHLPNCFSCCMIITSLFLAALLSQFEAGFNKTLRRLLNNLHSCAAARRDREGIALRQMGTNAVTSTMANTSVTDFLAGHFRNECVNQWKTMAFCLCLFTSHQVKHRYRASGPPSHLTIAFWGPTTFTAEGTASSITNSYLKHLIPYEIPNQNGCSTAKCQNQCPKKGSWEETGVKCKMVHSPTYSQHMSKKGHIRYQN